MIKSRMISSKGRRRYIILVAIFLQVLVFVEAYLSSEEERILSAMARIQEDDASNVEFRHRRTSTRRSKRTRGEESKVHIHQREREEMIRRSEEVDGTNRDWNVKQTSQNIRSSPQIQRSSIPTTSSMSSRTLRRHVNPSHPSTTKSSTTTTLPWVSKFLNERSKDCLLPVPKDFLTDGFNLAQLAPIVERIGFQVLGDDAITIAKQLMQVSQHSYPIYRLALQLILNESEDETSILHHPLIPPHAIQEAAQALFLMVHARFVSSPRGLDAIKRIARAGMFGRCPRRTCEGNCLLPYGSSIDYVGYGQNCKRYCPKCGEYWNFWDSKTDGCSWGPSLCHLVLLTHGSEIYPPTTTMKRENHDENLSAVMGFKIHPAAMFGKPLNERST